MQQHKYVTHHAKRDLKGIAKSIDPGQPAQCDHFSNFLLLPDFLCNNPLPDVPILGSSNAAANKDMMSKIFTNGATIF